MKISPAIIGISFVLLFLLTIALLLVIEKNKQLKERPTIDISKTDSMQVFYSKQLDSIKVENQLLQVKIEAKTETIRTLKGLVKENNEKINPNNSVPILDSLRRAGFGKD